MFDCYWGILEYGNTGIRDVTFVLSPSCVPPVASDQRSSGLLVFLSSIILSSCFLSSPIPFILYTRERGGQKPSTGRIFLVLDFF